MTARWEGAYVATSVLLGASADEAAAALDSAGAAHAAVVLLALRSTSRATRAKQLAVAVAEIARDLDEAKLAWR